MLLERDNYQPTLESLLVRRLEKVFEAMDIADGFLFDEIIEEIEMLMQLKPPAHNELIRHKNGLMDKAAKALEEASEMAEYASNEIQKRNFLSGEMSATEWDVRKEYLEKIVEVMGKHQMIPFEKPITADVQQAEIEQEEPEYYEEEEEEQEQEQKPVSKKPKVSKRVKVKKQTSEQPFEV
jgi:hypothetical protein